MIGRVVFQLNYIQFRFIQLNLFHFILFTTAFSVQMNEEKRT